MAHKLGGGQSSSPQERERFHLWAKPSSSKPSKQGTGEELGSEVGLGVAVLSGR